MPPFRRVLVPVADRYAAICAVLWSERELLESLACGVVMGQLLSYSGGSSAASREPTVDEAETLEKLRLQEVLRAAIVATVWPEQLGPANLDQLAGAAPEPWSTMLAEHGTALRALAADLTTLSGFDQLSLREFLARRPSGQA